MPSKIDLDSAMTRLKATLYGFGLPSEFVEPYANTVYRCSIEQQPWSSRSLLTIQTDGKTPLNIDASTLPTVTYYSPVKAAECAVSALSALFHATNPFLCGLSVLSAYLALRNLKTAVSQAETLLFSIVYNAESHSIETGTAKARFSQDAHQFGDITSADFDWAVHALQMLGCMLEDSGTLTIVGRVVVRD